MPEEYHYELEEIVARMAVRWWRNVSTQPFLSAALFVPDSSLTFVSAPAWLNETLRVVSWRQGSCSCHHQSSRPQPHLPYDL